MRGQMHDLDLRLLRIFRVVARQGGFVAAQTELNASLPTISLQIKQLEERLGVRLCERGNVGFRVTPAGETLLKSADRLFASIHDFKNEVAEVAKLPIGEVRLGIIDNLVNNPDCRIPSAIAELQERVPGAGISLFIGPPSELESQLLGGTLDMAVGIFSQRHASLRYTAIFREEHSLYCAKGHPLFDLPDASLDRESLLGFDYVSWSYLEPFVAQSIVHPSPKTGTPFMEAVACLILSRRYIGYLPSFFASQWEGRGLLRPLCKGSMSRHVEMLLTLRSSHRGKQIVMTLHDALLRAHGLSDLSEGLEAKS
jgi:LysR family transcriptional regulator, transcriptional activator for bauABCD operon